MDPHLVVIGLAADLDEDVHELLGRRTPNEARLLDCLEHLAENVDLGQLLFD